VPGQARAQDPVILGKHGGFKFFNKKGLKKHWRKQPTPHHVSLRTALYAVVIPAAACPAYRDDGIGGRAAH
jgi:hypothetical protein